MADLDPAQYLELALAELDNAQIDKIKSGVPPPNAPSTIKKKGSSTTLIDSGDALGSIDHKIELTDGRLIGFSGIFDPVIAEYMYYNEYGIGVPERSFQRSAWDENIDWIVEDLHVCLGDAIEDFWKD